MSRDLVVALSGGIGGAKLALGLSRIVQPEDLLVVANVGDDFEHLGLHISPDADTLMYTLAGLDNTKLGWGRQDETWSFMETLTALGGEDWFRLGDRDLAVHMERTRRIGRARASPPSPPTSAAASASVPRVLPATDDRLRTRLRTDEGWLDFQDYFVRLQCRPVVRELAFDGAENARPHPDLLAALGDERLRAVVICPSNPFISVEPILAVPGIRQAFPPARRRSSRFRRSSAARGQRSDRQNDDRVRHDSERRRGRSRYGDLIDGYVMDVADAEEAAQVAPKVTLAPTLMTTSLSKSSWLGSSLRRRTRSLLGSAGRTSSRDRYLGRRARQGIRGRQAPAVVSLKPGRTPRARDDHAGGRARRGERGPGARRRAGRHGRSGRDSARRRTARASSRKALGMAILAPSRPPRACSSERAGGHDDDARGHAASLVGRDRRDVAAHTPRPPSPSSPRMTISDRTRSLSPPDAVPLRFGEDSFFPHLAAARARGIEPLVVRHPGIGMDIDNPVDLVTFLNMSPSVRTRTLAFLEQSGVAGRVLKTR